MGQPANADEPRRNVTLLLAPPERRLRGIAVALMLTLAGLSLAGVPAWALIAATGLCVIVLSVLPGVAPALPPAPVSEGCQMQDRSAVISLLAGAKRTAGLHTAAIALRLDDRDRLLATHGPGDFGQIMQQLSARIGSALRAQDAFCALPGTGFGVALCPQPGLDLGRVLAVIHRLQRATGQPIAMGDQRVWVSVSAGFCISPRAAALSQIDMLTAAENAAAKALRNGPSGMSSYSVVDFPGAVSGDTVLDLRKALENGDIRPHFQPQLSADSGRVSGIEALARWHHPSRGLVSPAEFLPAIEASGLSPLLAQCMLRASLRTLSALDDQGLRVPTVAINLNGDDLRNPRLPDEIAWELDALDLTPERLVLEILETVVADSDDDVAVRTIARLAGMGCGIDLDDFGTGHASLANIRRFAVARLKIDRSFVTHLHKDPQQRRMVAAILSMAQQLDLATLAEGVETAEEQVMLAQMGCQHLQGFSIARPMPAEELVQWLRAHDAALATGEPACELEDAGTRASPPQAQA